MKLKPLLLILLTTFLISFAQIFYKFGVKDLDLTFQGIFLNYFLILGILMYAIGALILLVTLKMDDLSTLYPIIATGYIWVMILSNIFFNENLNYLKWVGIIAIVAGIAFIGFSSKTERYTEVVE